MSETNETLRVIAERYSCRDFTGKLPEREKLDAIALAAVQSPSSMNRQSWQIVVITDKALLGEMDAHGMEVMAGYEDKSAYERIKSRGGKLFYNAPCMFLILKQPGTELDCGIVSENIALAATALGLGNVICAMTRIPLGGPKGGAFKQKIGFPEGYEFGMSVLVGYAGKPGAAHAPDLSKIRFME